MKNKILYSVSILLILTFAFVVYASSSSAKTPVYANGDSCCAMKDCCTDGICKTGGECCKNHGAKEMSAMHNHDGKAECCKDGKCSMNSDCCKDGVCKMGCCKDGKCEMHKKDGEAKGDCCKGKDSCPMKKGENKDKPKDN